MATVQDLLQRFQRECGDVRPDPVAALAWLDDRHRQILERNKQSLLLKEATLATAAEITAGTVTVTNASTTVSETTTNANGWSSAVQTRYFRKKGDTEYYPIDTFTNGTPDTLTLNRAYEGDTATSASYSLFQRLYALASDVQEVVAMQRLNSATEMEKVDISDLNRSFPNRSELGDPVYWAYLGRNSSNVPIVELYPAPDTARGIQYHYIAQPPTLNSGDDSILPEVPEYLLRYGWMADYWMWRSTLADARGNELAMAQSYEAGFERRMREFSAKLATRQTPQHLRMARRFTKHRFRRDNRSRSPVELP